MQDRIEIRKQLFKKSDEELKQLCINVRAEENAGLLSSKEAHERINNISSVIMAKNVFRNEKDIPESVKGY